MHLYSPDGKPVYQVPYADPSKGMRDATLADARKLGLFPSVTEIFSVMAKPGLENWKIDQMMLACLTSTQLENETEESFIKRVKADAIETSIIARDKGQAIHDAVDKVFKEIEPEEHFNTAKEIEHNITTYLDVNSGYEAEISFANPIGYGGRIDLLHRKAGIIIDLKTKEKLDMGAKPPAYDEHCMQLVAYANGIGMPNARLVNVFSDWDGNCLFREWEQSEKERAWEMFLVCFSLWKLVKKYTPVKETTK